MTPSAFNRVLPAIMLFSSCLFISEVTATETAVLSEHPRVERFEKGGGGFIAFTKDAKLFAVEGLNRSGYLSHHIYDGGNEVGFFPFLLVYEFVDYRGSSILNPFGKLPLDEIELIEVLEAHRDYRNKIPAEQFVEMKPYFKVSIRTVNDYRDYIGLVPAFDLINGTLSYTEAGSATVDGEREIHVVEVDYKLKKQP